MNLYIKLPKDLNSMKNKYIYKEENKNESKI